MEDEVIKLKLDTECVEHSFTFEADDVCPVCEGIEIEQKRIVEILNDWQVLLCKCDVCNAVREIKEAIKGEQKDNKTDSLLTEGEQK